MDLREHYNNMWSSSLPLFLEGKFELDTNIQNPFDYRRGITLLARPEQDVKNRINQFLHSAYTIAPNQYYYPSRDIHVTIMSIISCYEGFKLPKVEVADYIQAVRDCLNNMPSFTISFKGITASPGTVMIQGFPKNDTLNQIRDRLRDYFQHSDLEQSLDKRYSINTAHMTVIRFKKQVVHHKKFIELLNGHRSRDFGSVKIQKLELVFNDWYQQSQNTQVLQKFNLL